MGLHFNVTENYQKELLDYIRTIKSHIEDIDRDLEKEKNPAISSDLLKALKKLLSELHFALTGYIDSYGFKGLSAVLK